MKRLTLALVGLLALAGVTRPLFGETIVTEQDFRNKVRFHSPLDIKDTWKINGTAVSATAADLNEIAGDIFTGNVIGDLTGDDINMSGPATDTLGFNAPAANKTNTIIVTIYNAADNRECVFKVQGTNDVGNTVRWFQEQVIIADSSSESEDSTVVYSIMLGGATTEVFRISSAGLTVHASRDLVIGEGKLADSTILSADIKNGEIIDADINASAAIASSKLAASLTAQTLVSNASLKVYGATLEVKSGGALTIPEGAITDSAVLSADIKNGEIVDADVNASAAIAVTKLGTGGIIPANSGASLTNIPNAAIVSLAAPKLTGNAAWATISNAMQTSISGDAVVAANGALTLTDNAAAASEIGPGWLSSDVQVWNTNILGGVCASCTVATAPVNPTQATITVQCKDLSGANLAAARTMRFWFSTPSQGSRPCSDGIASWNFVTHGTLNLREAWLDAELGTVTSTVFTATSHTDGTIDFLLTYIEGKSNSTFHVLSPLGILSSATVTIQ